MARLLEDIKAQSDWIVKAFGADRMKLDYSVESFKQIDRFFDLHSEGGNAKPGGRLAQDRGAILFSIGSYVGETIIKNVPGAVWKTNDEDPEGEINVEIVLPDGMVIWPVVKVIKRFKNGAGDGIYGYGVVVVKEIAGRDIGGAERKSWWKIW